MKCDDHSWFSFLVLPLEINGYVANKRLLVTYFLGLPILREKNQQPIFKITFLQNDGVKPRKEEVNFHNHQENFSSLKCSSNNIL